MSNCAICEVKLKFLNTPNFGSGKLKDGGIICTNCFKKINNYNTSIATKLKNYSVSEIKDLMAERDLINGLKNDRLNELRKHIESLELFNSSTFLNRKEIDELPNIIRENETIDNIIQGNYNEGEGILVSTDKRLIFIDKGILYGLKVEDFPLDKITSITYETKLLFGRVEIYTSNNVASIVNVEKNSARSFAEFVSNKLTDVKPEINLEKTNNDIFEQIERLAILRDKGILDEKEFEDQKLKLLQRL